MNTLSALTVIYGTEYDRQKNNRSKSGCGAQGRTRTDTPCGGGF